MGRPPGNGIYRKMGNNSSLSLKQLSLKLATLLAITCPKRVSSLARLDINHLRLSPEGATFTLTTPTKTVTAFFSSFQTNLVLCPVDCLNSYISITKRFQNLSGKEPNILFISHIKPHQAVTTATVACWIRSIWKDAGVDTSIFKTHSVRGAATSAAANAFTRDFEHG